MRSMYYLLHYRRGAIIILLSTAGWLANATTDFVSIISLAKERYNEDAVETVLQWQQLLENAKLLSETEQLTLINQFFNGRIFFADDSVIWGQSDYWATPLETMGRQQGDCEDFTIAKYISLRMLGVANEQLRLMYVKARITTATNTRSQAHMVLAYYPPGNSEPLILDNLITTIKPASLRPDLSPVFGFNSEGLWIKGAVNPTIKKPAQRLSKWRDLLLRMHKEGF